MEIAKVRMKDYGRLQAVAAAPETVPMENWPHNLSHTHCQIHTQTTYIGANINFFLILITLNFRHALGFLAITLWSEIGFLASNFIQQLISC